MRTPFLSVMFVVLVLLSTTLGSTALSIGNAGVVKGGLPRWFDYVVIILMENHGINQTYGSSCIGSNCAFFNDLANANGLAENYDKGGVPGSLGDYIALTSGNGSVTCNSQPQPGGCGPFNEANIVDRVEGAHLSWKAYMEDYPPPCVPNTSGCSSGGCFTNFSPSLGNYVSIHNPFVYYQNVLNNSSRCSKITPANAATLPQTACGPSLGQPGTVQTDNLFLNDLGSASTASNYMFLSPNTIDDAHDCADVSTANLYLKQLVPQILNSTLFKTQRAALFVTYDEQDGWGANRPELYTVWASHAATYTKPTFKSIQHYTHFSTLRTIEDNWGFLPFFDSTNDGTASNMGEFFPPF